jgi:hypothetical protein
MGTSGVGSVVNSGVASCRTCVHGAVASTVQVRSGDLAEVQVDGDGVETARGGVAELVDEAVGPAQR